jgi:hypothetical protein
MLQRKVGEARAEFRKLLNFGQSVLKLEGIMWKMIMHSGK